MSAPRRMAANLRMTTPYRYDPHAVEHDERSGCEVGPACRPLTVAKDGALGSGRVVAFKAGDRIRLKDAPTVETTVQGGSPNGTTWVMVDRLPWTPHDLLHDVVAVDACELVPPEPEPKPPKPQPHPFDVDRSRLKCGDRVTYTRKSFASPYILLVSWSDEDGTRNTFSSMVEGTIVRVERIGPNGWYEVTE